MALIQMNAVSQCLMRTVTFNVILPTDKMLPEGAPPRPQRYKTLYLLHGVLGNYTDWVTGTRVQRFAEEHDLAVVMPSGDNAFYLDHEAAHNYYGEFIGRELVELTRRSFPLSDRREDTFIGGLSMGGYGALRNGMLYADTFGCIAALSAAVHLEETAALTGETEGQAFFANKRFAEATFGELSTLLESDKNPAYTAAQRKKAGQPLPRVYMACGDADPLLPANRRMAAALAELGVDVTFEVDPGDHEWDFWDSHIRKAIEWLPTEYSGLGRSSGNVGL